MGYDPRRFTRRRGLARFLEGQADATFLRSLLVLTHSTRYLVASRVRTGGDDLGCELGPRRLKISDMESSHKAFRGDPHSRAFENSKESRIGGFDCPKSLRKLARRAGSVVWKCDELNEGEFSPSAIPPSGGH